MKGHWKLREGKGFIKAKLKKNLKLKMGISRVDGSSNEKKKTVRKASVFSGICNRFEKTF